MVFSRLVMLEVVLRWLMLVFIELMSSGWFVGCLFDMMLISVCVLIGLLIVVLVLCVLRYVSDCGLMLVCVYMLCSSDVCVVVFGMLILFGEWLIEFMLELVIMVWIVLLLVSV